MPSWADLFYVGFFPLCFLALAFLIRRGNRSSLVTTSLDGLIAGLGVAALSAAFVVAAVINVTHAGALSTATSLSYPLGDILLFTLCIGGLAVLPKGFRPFFAVAASPWRPTPSATDSTSCSPRAGWATSPTAPPGRSP